MKLSPAAVSVNRHIIKPASSLERRLASLPCNSLASNKIKARLIGYSMFRIVVSMRLRPRESEQARADAKTRQMSDQLRVPKMRVRSRHHPSRVANKRLKLQMG